MRRLLLTGIFLVARAYAQISGAGQLGCQTAPVTGAAWSSATALNTTQILTTNAAVGQVMVTLDQTTPITGGAITFLLDYGDGNFVSVPAVSMLTPNGFLPMSNPYTLTASTNQPFIVILGGAYRLQLKLTTVIAGAGTVTPYTVPICYQPPVPLGIYNSSLPTLTAGQSVMHQFDANGRLIVNGAGGTFPASESGSWTVQPGNTANTTPWLMTGTGGIFPATESGTWTVQPGNTANTTPWLVSVTPSATGGWSKSFYSAQTTTVQTPKASAGIFGGYFIDNTMNSAPTAIQVFDASSPTLGSTTPNMCYDIPANGAANVELVNGVNMTNAIKLAAATTCTGSTAPATGVNITVYWK